MLRKMTGTIRVSVLCEWIHTQASPTQCCLTKRSILPAVSVCASFRSSISALVICSERLISLMSGSTCSHDSGMSWVTPSLAASNTSCRFINRDVLTTFRFVVWFDSDSLKTHANCPYTSPFRQKWTSVNFMTLCWRKCFAVHEKAIKLPTSSVVIRKAWRASAAVNCSATRHGVCVANEHW